MKRTLIIPTLLGLLWTMLLAVLLLWSIMGEQRHINELAQHQAKAMFQQIVATRSWNAENGGVFVPRGENAAPNPYLPPEERVLRGEDGRELVKVNPAFMTRLIADIASARNDVRFHITSLAPVRPENVPDTWERETLTLLAPDQDRFELTPGPDGAGKFRYMAPLICEGSCVSCHVTEQIGSVRGGISVSIPAGPLLGYQEANLRKQVTAYGIIWVIGLLGLGGTSFELNRRKLAAEASNQTKSRFLANMSHDMRTPLTGILGLTERMLLHRGLDSRDARYAKLIAHSAKNLLEVVGDILDFSRLDSGRLDIKPQPFEPRLAVDKTAGIFAFAAEDKGLAFYVRVEESTPELLVGDEFRFRQVLANLLGNAVKFTDQGEVALSVSAAPEGQGGWRLRCAVRDTGVGLDPAHHEVIFGCFNQVDGSLSRRHAGSGLGLSIARQLARLMGGDITLESRPGQGSLFVFTARMGRTEGVAEAGSLASELRDGRGETGHGLAGRTVLVVDDHKVNRILLSDILDEQGALPRLAQSGQEAIERLRRERCDLILMDLQMPGMGGVEAIERIRALEREQGLPRTPVIVLTAFASPAEAAALPAGEIEALVGKPIDVPLLLRTMDEALSGRTNAVASPEPAGQSGMEAALLDVEAALKLLSGRRDFYAMLAGEFFSCSGGLQSSFEKAAAERDFREAARIAHIIKTSAAALGANRLGSMAAGFERMAMERVLPGDDERRNLGGLLNRTLDALRQAVSGR
jgi:signal transduction histidine kinase/CheY-like chemotaxis protein/HPt (histidine-containing phosphotransfer) domain-containing protein